MRHAIIENGTVTNIAEASEAFGLSQGWIASESAKIGDRYEGGEFLPPALDLAQLAADKKAQIDAERDELLQAGVPYSLNDWEDTVQTRQHDQTNLLAMRIAAESAQAAGVTDPVLEFRGLANIQRHLTPDEMIEMTDHVLAYCQGVYQQSWSRKDALAAIDLDSPNAAHQIEAV